MFMRRMNNLFKKDIKRMIAALLAVVMIIAFVPSVPVQAYNGKTQLGIAENKEPVLISNMSDVDLAASALATKTDVDSVSGVQRALDAGLKNNSGRSDVIRAVLDNIEELPQYGNAGYKSLERGTAQRPFVILEIVPAEELGEFGYLVGGCEPTRLEELQGHPDELGIVSTLNTGTLISPGWPNNYNTYFFLDEKEGNSSYYNNCNFSTFNSWIESCKGQEITHYGYYEYVGSENGYFSIVDGKMEKIGKDKGEYVWHTINQVILDIYTQKGITFNDAIKPKEKLGERIYTTRVSYNIRLDNSDTGKTVDQVASIPSWAYKAYVNKELFLKDTLLLSDYDAEEYSCVIKTITPDELNKNPSWIDYSDLIYIFPQEHNATSTYWKKMIDGEPANRLGHTSDKTSYSINDFETNDISAEVALEILNRATAKDGYVAVILDDRLFNMGYVVTDKSKNKSAFDLKVYTWDMKDTGLVQNVGVGSASSCNIFKLCLMLITLNPEIVRQYFVDRGLIKVGEDNFSLVLDSSYQTGDASMYWSFYSLQMIDDEYYEKYKDNYGYNTHMLYMYASDDDNWEKYGSVGEHVTNYKQSVRNHVYAYPGDNSVAMNYVGGTINSDNTTLSNGDYRFKDFRDTLDESVKKDESGENKVKVNYEAGKADSSDAVRYILGLMGGKNEQKRDEPPVVEVEKADMTQDNTAGQSGIDELTVENVSDSNEYSITISKSNPDANYVRVYFRPKNMGSATDINVRISYTNANGKSAYIEEVWAADEADALYKAQTDNYMGLKSNNLYYFYYNKSDIVAVGNRFTFEVTNSYYSDVEAAHLTLYMKNPPTLEVETAYMTQVEPGNKNFNPGQNGAELQVDKIENDENFANNYLAGVLNEDDYKDGKYVRVYFKPKNDGTAADINVRISYTDLNGRKAYIEKIWSADANTLYEAQKTDSYCGGLQSDKLYYFYYERENIAQDVGTRFTFEISDGYYSDITAAYLTLYLKYPPTIEVEKADMTRNNTSGQQSVYNLGVDKSGDDKLSPQYMVDVPDEDAKYVRMYFRPKDISLFNNLDVRISYSNKNGSKGYINEVWTAEAYADEAAGTLHLSGDGSSNYFVGLNNNKLYYFYYEKSKIKSDGDTFMFEVNNNRSLKAGLAYLKLSLQTLYELD